MATIEIASLDVAGHARKERHFNLTKSVGVGQPNLFDDVMVVQALLELVRASAYAVYLEGADLPAVSGVFDTKTRRSIWHYQRTHTRFSLLRIDGIVHPASLEGRTMRMVRRQMTIVELNYEAGTAHTSIEAFGYDPTRAILAKYPVLFPFVVDKTR